MKLAREIYIIVRRIIYLPIIDHNVIIVRSFYHGDYRYNYKVKKMPERNGVHIQIAAGTDTSYAPTNFSDIDKALIRIPDGYDYYETLSLIHDGIIGEVRSIPQPPIGVTSSQISAYKYTAENTQSSMYVNGPETMGKDVGCDIVQNLVGILIALDSGKRIINIIAHSRGACAAILALNELQAIKDNNETDSTLYMLLSRTSCRYTKAYLLEHKSQLEPQFNALINVKTHIQDAEFNLFAVDPVPGGSWNGTGRITRWTDERFYNLPALVNEAVFIYKEHERSRSFKAIKTKTKLSTKITILNLPGHHGTASGNLQDQQRAGKFLDMIPFTAPIQELLVCQLSLFLIRHQVEFKQSFLNQVAPTQKKQLELYEIIFTHKKVYERLTKQGYSFLGLEQDKYQYTPEYYKQLCGVKDQRIIHWEAHNNVYLHDKLPIIPGCVNSEHLYLKLACALGMLNTQQFEQLSPSILLQNFHQKLKDSPELSSSEEINNNLTLQIIETISQQYLRNHLSSDEKQRLIRTINEFLTFLSNKEERLLQNILKLSKDTLVKTVRERFDRLFVQNQALIKKDIFEKLTIESEDTYNKRCREYKTQRQLLLVQFTEFQENLPGILMLCQQHQIEPAPTELQPLICEQRNALLESENHQPPLVARSDDSSDADGSSPLPLPVPNPSTNPSSDDEIPVVLHTARPVNKREASVEVERPVVAIPIQQINRAPNTFKQVDSPTNSLAWPLVLGISTLVICFTIMLFGQIALLGLSVLASALLVSVLSTVGVMAFTKMVQVLIKGKAEDTDKIDVLKSGMSGLNNRLPGTLEPVPEPEPGLIDSFRVTRMPKMRSSNPECQVSRPRSSLE